MTSFCETCGKDAAGWQTNRRPSNAIPVQERLPPEYQEVWGWVCDQDVAIHAFPAVVWRTGQQWWSGLPGTYIDLRRWKWTVTHWLPIKGEQA